MVVFSVDYWFSLNVKSQPKLIHFIFLSFEGGKHPRVQLVNTTQQGNKYSFTIEEIAIVTCLLFSTPNT
jgi:hypothetical protein